MSRGVRGTGDQWDVKGQDVPGGRFSRSLVMGLGNVEDAERKKEIKRRRQALNRLRAHARNAEDHRDREALWALIPKIGLSGFPTWDEVVAAVREVDYLALAHRGELHAETNARRDRDADNSERRTCAHSVDEYLRWQETQEFAEETKAQFALWGGVYEVPEEGASAGEAASASVELTLCSTSGTPPYTFTSWK